MAKQDKSNERGYTSYSGYSSYTGGDYGYGYEVGQSRSLADYIILLRERVWYIIIIFLVVATGSALYTFKKTPIYSSAAMVQIYRADPEPIAMGTGTYAPEVIRSAEDLNTEINFLNSSRLISAVENRIQGEERRQFMLPYEGAFRLSGPLTVGEVLARNRRIQPVRMSLNVQLGYSHPDPVVAARVATLFAEEYVALSLSRGLERTIRAVEDIRREAESKRRRVEDLERELNDYRRRYNSPSIERTENVAISVLQADTARLNDAQTALLQVTNKKNLIEQFESEGRPLWTLDFIAANPLVSHLLSQRSAATIQISTLSQRYRDRYPLMIEARQNLKQINEELAEAVATARATIWASWEQMRDNYNSMKAKVDETQQKILELADIRAGYNSILREFEVTQAGYQQMISQLAIREAQTNWKGSQAEIIDRAGTPAFPSSPNVPLNLAAGLFSGLALGLGFAILLAYLDNRVKSAYDVEELVGLPLLGIVPKMDRRLSSAERGRAVFSGLDTKVTESFRTIHSSINLNDQGKLAQVILSTSTLPAEGKTFIATNLALTFAAQGQKTLIIDADLRLPIAGRSFGIDPEVGLHSYFFEDKALDDVIVSEVAPNCDLLPLEKTPSNPTQVLNSVEFEEMLIELRHKYHKIVIDSPPVGAVSDALCLLPLVDGVVFVIKFNDVKRKAAKAAVQTISESETPIFGAVMNAISAKMSNYYYSHYYDYSYHSYYNLPKVGERRSLKQKGGAVELEPAQEDKKEKAEV